MAEFVTHLFIRRLDFLLFAPTGPGPPENIGGTGVSSATRILIHRPHDGGVPITGDGDGRPEKVIRLFIRRLDFLLLGPVRVGPGENIGGTRGSILSTRPHDGGVPIIRDGNGSTEIGIPLYIRRLDFLLFAPTGPGPGENIGGTGAEQGIGAYNRILIHRPHDGGVPILRDGNGSTEIVAPLYIRRLDFLLLGPAIYCSFRRQIIAVTSSFTSL